MDDTPVSRASKTWRTSRAPGKKMRMTRFMALIEVLDKLDKLELEPLP